MKKTIVAAAIAAAVAAPAAFADVSISGQFTVEYGTNGADAEMTEASDVVFSGSEDLGNGMSAFFKIATSPDGTDGSMGEDDQYVGLKGDFGTLMFGQYEQLISAKGTDMANSLASSERLSVEQKEGAGVRGNQGIRYSSPNFNGVTVEIGGFMDGTDNQSSSAENFDSTEMMVQYSANGLTVRYISESNEDANEDKSVVAATYAMGDLTVGVSRYSTDIANSDATVVAAKYTMGANSIGAAFVAAHDTAATEGDFIIKATHAMSKSTSVWVGYENDDNLNSDLTLGMKHAF
jgi:predicted porin